MKYIKTLALCLVSFSLPLHAGQITLTLADESESGQTKYCFYENSNYSFTYEVPLSRQCPFTRTFETDEENE